MRKYGKIDRNQPEIVEALERIGCSVVSLASVGDGCGDILVGYRGFNFLMEIKDGKLPPSRQQLTPAESKFHVRWRGSIVTVNSTESALHVVQATMESDGLLVNAYLGARANCQHKNRVKESGAVFCEDCGETLKSGPVGDDYA